jgi:hypothetical protein
MILWWGWWCYDEVDEYLKRFYEFDEYDDKIKLLSEFFKVKYKKLFIKVNS